jgi:Ca2+-binding RTX toxin-like protein
MAMLTPPSTIGAGPLFELGALDSITVQKNVALVSTSGHVINAVGSDHTAIVNGTVIGHFFGIVLGASSPTYSGNTVIVAKSGTVMGLGPSGGAIGCYGFDASIVNHGYVEGTRYGVGLYNNSTTTHSTVVNTGTITAGQAGVYRDGGTTTETIVLKNSGLIESAGMAYGFLGGPNHTGRDLITNTGVMIGDVTMTGGDDRYDGRKGRVEGDVSGGNDADILMGGKEANSFFGDAGLDKLTGGLGADLLTGGAEADQFIYKSARDSSVKAGGQDTIMDFTQVQNDRINLTAIDADTKSGGNQKFDFIGSEAFSGNAGELRFKQVVSDTVIYGDTNGDGRADFAIKLDTAVTLTAGDFNL